MDGGDEDQRHVLEARMLADHRGKLEAVLLGHADIDKDDRDLRLQKLFEGLARGGRLDQVLAQLCEHDFIAQELRGLIVHEQDVDLVAGAHGSRSTGAATCAAPKAAVRC